MFPYGIRFIVLSGIPHGFPSEITPGVPGRILLGNSQEIYSRILELLSGLHQDRISSLFQNCSGTASGIYSRRLSWIPPGASTSFGNSYRDSSGNSFRDSSKNFFANPPGTSYDIRSGILSGIFWELFLGAF